MLVAPVRLMIAERKFPSPLPRFYRQPVLRPLMAGNLVGPLIGGILPPLIGIRSTFLLSGAAIFVSFLGTTFLLRLPLESRKHVLQVDLRALGIRDFGRHRQFGHGLPVVPAPMELFWNDSVMQVARYPNIGAIDIGPIIDPGSVPRDGDYTNRGNLFGGARQENQATSSVSGVDGRVGG